MVIDQGRQILTAFTFLTRLPLRGGGDDVGRAAVWFPFVGLVIGALIGMIHVALSELTTPLVAASVAIAVGAAVTGGFHEDGLGDMADGFGGGWTKDRRLEIMNDSRLGTYGVVAIVATVVIRVAALASLTGWRTVALVAVVHLLSRTWAMLTLGFARPARSDGLAAGLRAHSGGGRMGLFAVAWFALAGVAVGPARAAVIGGIGLVGALATVGLSYRKIDGVTGDVLGGVEQVAETTGFVAATLSRGT